MKLRNQGMAALLLASAGALGHADPVGAARVQRGTVWDVVSGEALHHVRARLRRDSHGVCLSADTRSLPEGAYTVWWVIYNKPAHCNNPVPYGEAACGDLDITNSAVRATVMWAKGVLVGQDGRAHLNACIGTGELTREVFDMGTKEGLLDPAGAEIQLVVHWHAAARYDAPLALGEQLTRFVGGCVDPEGRVAPPCRDAQQIVFVSTPSVHDEEE